MAHQIEAIFLDTGNTMRVVVKDANFQTLAQSELAELVGTVESPDDFYRHLRERYGSYKKKTKDTWLQSSETEVWTRWMLPEYPSNQITPLASQLTLLWHDCDGHRITRPEVKPTIIELHRRGYVLGIIANSLSEIEIPNWLDSDGLTKYFKAVILSSKFGRRKPDPYIYHEAAYRAGVRPQNCAYVGDNPNRDIQGALQAGFGMTVILLEPDTLSKETYISGIKPDHIIHKLDELSKICPVR